MIPLTNGRSCDAALFCLSRRWQTRECYEMARILKFMIEDVERLDWELAEMRTAIEDEKSLTNAPACDKMVGDSTSRSRGA